LLPHWLQKAKKIILSTTLLLATKLIPLIRFQKHKYHTLKFLEKIHESLQMWPLTEVPEGQTGMKIMSASSKMV